MERIYLGLANGGDTRKIFKAAITPTRAAYPQYDAVVGPFKTMRGARFMQQHVFTNPHCQTVSDAEKLGKKYNA